MPVGSVEWSTARAYLPEGPLSPDEFFNWQNPAFAKLIDTDAPDGAQRRRRISIINDIEIHAKSHYSGKGTFELILCWMNTLFIAFGIATADVAHSHSATDRNSTCIHVLCAMKGSHGEKLIPHVFGDMDDRLDPVFRKRLDGLDELLAPGVGLQEHISLMEDVILESASAGCLFRPDFKAPCLVCHKDLDIVLMMLRESCNLIKLMPALPYLAEG